MFAISSATHFSSATALAVRPRNARHCRRTASVRVCASEYGDRPVVFTAEQLTADAGVKVAAESTETTGPASPPAAVSAAVDPADGSIAEAAPLGDDFSMFSAAMVAFKEPRAVEIINGRVAMIGWMAALVAEFADNHSLTRQVLNTRTFTLADGMVRTSTMPAEGMFLIPVTVLVVIAASLAPQLNNAEKNGLDEVPDDFAMFKASSEMINGRGAMIGLVSLFLAEKFTNGAPLF